VKVTVLENIMEGPDADRIMTKAVADGNKFLIAGSFGYQNGALQIARRDPSVTVLHASGYQVAPNFSPFAAKYFQGTYLLGMASAALSKSGKLGSVSAFAIPELITSINAFALGAQAVNPNIEVSVVWVNSWFDPAKEQEAAKALIAQGCDVIFSNAQDTPSVVAACEEAGVFSFNLNSSMKQYAEKTYLGCVATDWSPFFKASVDAHLAGTFKGANAFLGVADKVVQVVDWNPAVPADMMAKIKETEAKIADGSFSPFTGPLTKADGSEGVAAGVVMTDAEIVAMDWHVKGVTTPLPQ
jgi:simple sugar transport system substrate-binding protein